MAAGGECDFYAVLGLKKECSAAELRSAYKMLALRWHPDRCSASGNSKFVEEAKQKFQAIQEAYSVLSDANKRFLYDMGVYNGDDDDENGMGDFFGEMAVMMSQANAKGAREESFEELQELFEEMFQQDSYESSSFVGNTRYTSNSSTSNVHHPSNSSTANSNSSNTKRSNDKNRRNGSDLNSGLFNFECNFSSFEAGQSFCTGVGGGNSGGGGRNGKRNARKHKVSTRHDVSSCDSRIST